MNFTMSNVTEIDYAKYYGITQAPAIAVAILFGIFLILCSIYAALLFREKTVRSVFPSLCLFSLVRVVAFALRAKVATDGTNVNLFVIEQIVYSAGFFAVVNVCFNLLKTWVLHGKSIFSADTQKLAVNISRISHIVLLVAVGVGIYGGIKSTPTNSPSDIHTGLNLTHISRWIFLALTLVYLLLSLCGAVYIFRYEYQDDCTAQMKKPIIVLVVLGFIINVRTIFNVAANTHTWIFYDQHLFYSLSVLPELLILSTYCIPGVVRRFAYTPSSSDSV
eukprot:Phypoly_transcript_12605.p1 GENE.Phypoly_transcript_12605~~Phypoly_transcript_12605.p1  ORF type:complete len:277 (+),score=23.01 Phypoly_transcript_12605:243-1073(+)